MKGSLHTFWRVLRGVRETLDGAVPEPTELRLHLSWRGHAIDVTLQRHELGAPIIEAEDERSLYFGLGYAMARDRYVQMDLARRLAYGRFAELVGDLPLPKEGQIFGAKRVSDIDLFIAGFRFETEAARQTAELEGVVKEELEAFVAGINHQLLTQDALPPEYLIFGAPKPWTLKDTVALSMSAGLLLDITSLDHEFVVNTLINAQHGDVAAALYRHSGLKIPVKDKRVEFGPTTFGPHGGGSNAWAVSAEKSASGKPMLASDPHLPLSPLPNIWYHVILRSPEIDFSGLAFTGSPSFPVGHNGHAAWGSTAAQRDAFDITRVLITQDCSKYLTPEGWVATDRLDIEIPRRMQSPRKETIYGCEHGTIFPKWKGWDDTALALRMAGAAHTRTMVGGGNAQQWYSGIRQTLRSRSWDEHREGLGQMNCGNLGIHHIYADVDGTIAHQTYGLHPRRSDEQGVVPRASWEEGSGWESYLSLDELPHVVNPERGYVLSANAEPSREVGGEWPYIAAVFEPPWRFETLRSILERNDKADVELFRQMQMNTFSAPAQKMVASMLPLFQARKHVDRHAMRLLQDWDGCYDPQSGAAVLFEHIIRRGSHACWLEVLGEICGARFHLSRMSTRRFVELCTDAEDPLHPLLAEKKVDLDHILQEAFRESVDALCRSQGNTPILWRLDRGQFVKLVHPLSALPGFGSLFDIGRFSVAGNEYAPQAQSASVDGDELSVMIGPVSRFICDLNDPTRGYWAQSSGASGRPGSMFYGSTTLAWLQGALYQATLGRPKP